MHKKESNEFIAVNQVIAIHLERYDRQIAKLLATEDYSDQELDKLSRFEFIKAREKKTKAYLDCLSTMQQKEKVLQFHHSGFELQVVEETINVIQSKPKYNFSKLNLEEQIELYNLMKKAKVQDNYIAPISIAHKPETKSIEVKSTVVEEIPNITYIKHEKPPDPISPSIPSTDPTQRLKEALKLLAVKKFKEAGGNLTPEEEKLIK